MSRGIRKLPSGLYVAGAGEPPPPAPPPPAPEPPADVRLCRVCGRPEPGEPDLCPIFHRAPAGWWDHWFTCRHERPVTCPDCAKGFPADYRGCSVCGCGEEYT